MSFSPFSWLRRQAAQAVVAGVSDGLAAVAPNGEPPPDLDGLRARLAEAVAPAKALPEHGDEEETEAPAPRRGKK